MQLQGAVHSASAAERQADKVQEQANVRFFFTVLLLEKIQMHFGPFCRYDIREKFKSINTALCSFRRQTRGARKLDSQSRIRHLEKSRLEKRCEVLQASNAKLQAESKTKIQSLVR